MLTILTVAGLSLLLLFVLCLAPRSLLGWLLWGELWMGLVRTICGAIGSALGRD